MQKNYLFEFSGIEIYNDGPVTLTIDTQTLQLNRGASSSSSSSSPEAKQKEGSKTKEEPDSPIKREANGDS